MSTSFDLSGKIALVTGGSRGLGFEMSRALSAAGATVIVASRKFDSCVESAERITAETGVTAVPLAFHAGRWSEIDAAVERIYADHGRVDILVNNVGLSPLFPSLEDVGEELFDKVLDVNLKGPFRLTTQIGARMREQGSGSIINISSIGSQRPSPVELPYSAAKAGLNALTQGFAQAYAPQVRVNAVLPGAFRTDMTSQWTPEVEAEILHKLPAGRMGEAAEIAGAVVYLASDAASYTTGALLTVDGGRTTLF